MIPFELSGERVLNNRVTEVVSDVDVDILMRDRLSLLPFFFLSKKPNQNPKKRQKEEEDHQATMYQDISTKRPKRRHSKRTNPKKGPKITKKAKTM